jgi:hypothetical protein
MNHEMHKYLIDVAHGEKEYITYQELCTDLKLTCLPNSPQLGKWLTEISNFEWRKNRPVLSAIVVNSETKRPGGGFSNCEGVKAAITGEEPAYYEKLMLEVKEYWRNEDNYTKSKDDTEPALLNEGRQI